MSAGARRKTSEYNVPLVVGGVVVGVFFGGVGAGVAFPTLPTLGSVLGISAFVVGVILSTAQFGRLVLNAPAGQIIDTVGARKPMMVGLLLQAVGPFGYIAGLYPDQVPLLGAAGIFVVSRLVWGAGSAFVFVGAFSIVSTITTAENRGKWMGYYRAGQSLGIPAGLVLGGIVTDLYGYDAAFLTAGGLGLFAMGVAALVLPSIAPSVEEPARLRDLPDVVRAEPAVAVVGVVNLVVRLLLVGLVMSTVVLYADAYGIRFGNLSSLGASGIFLGLAMVSISATTLVSGRLSDHVGNRVLVVLPAFGALALGFLLLAAFPTLPAVLAAVVCIGVGVGGTNPPLMAFLADVSPDADVGKIGGVYNVFGDVGATLGPLLALPVAAAVGYRTEYLLGALLAVFALALVVRLLLRGTGTGAETTAVDD